METTFIYCLTEPGTRAIRYFGKAGNPKKRLIDHIRDATGRKKKYHVSCWIRGLLKLNKRPDVHVLCEVDFPNWENLERAFIALGREHGMDLTNITEGGDGAAIFGERNPFFGKGPMLGKKHSLETRKKMSDARAGEKHPHFGKKFSSEYRAKLSAAHLGLNAGEKHPMFGKHHTAATRAKISATKRAQKLSLS